MEYAHDWLSFQIFIGRNQVIHKPKDSSCHNFVIFRVTTNRSNLRKLNMFHLM